MLYNAILLSIWLWHYSLASVISLCLKLFNSDKNSSEEHNYSTRIHYIRTWSVNYFSCLLGWCGSLLMTINTTIISPWPMKFRTGSFSFLLVLLDHVTSLWENGCESALNFIECLANMKVLLLSSVMLTRMLPLIKWG